MTKRNNSTQFIHVLGFGLEQKCSDRAEHVDVLYENIEVDKKLNESTVIRLKEFAYDYSEMYSKWNSN